jgi:hypothetical protein
LIWNYELSRTLGEANIVKPIQISLAHTRDVGYQDGKNKDNTRHFNWEVRFVKRKWRSQLSAKWFSKYGAFSDVSLKTRSQCPPQLNLIPYWCSDHFLAQECNIFVSVLFFFYFLKYITNVYFDLAIEWIRHFSSWNAYNLVLQIYDNHFIF